MLENDLYNKKYALSGCRGSITTSRQVIDRKILRWLDPQKDDRILEIGCNRGALVEKLRGYSDHVVGIDTNRWAVNNSLTGDLLVMNAEKLAFKDERFDKIVSSHTIEHIDNLRSLFEEISRVLIPGGLVVLVYPLEIFRGMAALRSAWKAFRGLGKARKLHRHRLSPRKIKKWITQIELEFAEGGILWGYFPTNYYTLLRRPVCPEAPVEKPTAKSEESL